MICVQNGPLNCKNSSPRRMHKKSLFWYTPSPHSTLSATSAPCRRLDCRRLDRRANGDPLSAPPLACGAWSLGVSSLLEVWLRPWFHTIILKASETTTHQTHIQPTSSIGIQMIQNQISIHNGSADSSNVQKFQLLLLCSRGSRCYRKSEFISLKAQHFVNKMFFFSVITSSKMSTNFHSLVKATLTVS